MNRRQRLAFENPLVQGCRADEHLFDEIVTMDDDLVVVTRILCHAPKYGTFGNWQARATVLTESGEALSTIWLEEEVKAKIFHLLRELLHGVGETRVSFVELANAISATKDLTSEEFEKVLQRVTGEPADSEYDAE